MNLRPFRPDDAAAVASLWQYWFRDKTRTPAPGLIELVLRLYHEHPNQDPAVRPLVAEGDDGRLLGFLGVTTTPVRVDGRPETLAGVFPPVVDPDAPTSVASFLLRKFLAGPQAFTVSDGGHVKYERIWETLGGRIVQMPSMRWVKVFRPAGLGAERLAGRPTLRPFRPALVGVARGVDALARRVAPRRLRAARSDARGEPLTPAGLLEANAELHAGARLRPEYTEAYLHWLFTELALSEEQGRFTATLVRDPRGAIAGWYAYYLHPGGLGRVFALEARPRALDTVVDHLFGEADAGGAAALLGRLEPRLRRPLAPRGALVVNGGSLLMVHARDASLMDDAELGRLAFTRFEGENWYWWRLIARRPTPPTAAPTAPPVEASRPSPPAAPASR